MPGILKNSVLAPTPDEGGHCVSLGAFPKWPHPLKAEKLTALATYLLFLEPLDLVTLLTPASPSVQGDLQRQQADVENAVTS